MSPGELQALQQTDPSLEKVRQQADQGEGPLSMAKETSGDETLLNLGKEPRNRTKGESN